MTYVKTNIVAFCFVLVAADGFGTSYYIACRILEGSYRTRTYEIVTPQNPALGQPYRINPASIRLGLRH
ncbi:hypothetical protein CC86DRAFT_81874 [Ophiobolus disseminans]|uniref:Uncharacterized protein n=1 Tax=Ophiobolus disseminans TaxID=1469910 RepID=A0A6A6ZNQ8_9PLEO|nr:hypothetical protein CC86DRAFT_81874 [Ophiobolus disseminans]